MSSLSGIYHKKRYRSCIYDIACKVIVVRSLLFYINLNIHNYMNFMLLYITMIVGSTPDNTRGSGKI